MNIDGTNDLACLKGIDEVKGSVAVYPLPHLKVVKDLVPDLTNFYVQLQSIDRFDEVPQIGQRVRWRGQGSGRR